MDAEAYNDRGVELFRRGDFPEAEANVRRAVALRPDLAYAHYNLGMILIAQEKYAEAVEACRESVRLRPDVAESHYSLGVSLHGTGEFAGAISRYREALRLRPGYADALHRLGVSLADVGRTDEAVVCFREALRLDPGNEEAHWALGMALLTLGDYEQGWREYEWRRGLKTSPCRPIARPEWDGEPLEGRTILLHDEGGLGDTVQMVRYAPIVRARGGRVIVACQRPLLRLLQTCPGIDQLLGPGDPVPAFDVHAPMLSLPRLCGTTLASVPANVPYLAADPDRIALWRERLGPSPAFRIGIAWQGSPLYPKDRSRSVPLARFEELARVEGVRLIGLQKGPGVEQLRALDGRFPVVDLGDDLDRDESAFLDTAAIMRNLDLVIAPDTMLAHLAGALGVPVWIALSHVSDWRWLRGREDSPWYPTARLFRQGWPGDWDDVFRRIAKAVRQALGDRPSIPEKE